MPIVKRNWLKIYDNVVGGHGMELIIYLYEGDGDRCSKISCLLFKVHVMFYVIRDENDILLLNSFSTIDITGSVTFISMPFLE